GARVADDLAADPNPTRHEPGAQAPARGVGILLSKPGQQCGVGGVAHRGGRSVARDVVRDLERFHPARLNRSEATATTPVLSSPGSGMAETRPLDRTPFFEFQARNRRATWRLSLALAVIVGGCGFVSAVGFVVNIFLALFAIVFFPTVLCLGIGALFLLSPTTAGLTRPLWDIGVIPLEIVGRIPNLFPGEGHAVWMIGLLLPLICWLTVRSVWLAAGVGHTLLTIGARSPATGEPGGAPAGQ